jgi:DNA polymerase III epsilon subunit-like protein
MSFKHLDGVMFDLETLGTHPGCVILSVGACRFNLDTKTIQDEFYVTIDIRDSLSKGLFIEKDTLDWWKKQNPAALKGIMKDTKPLQEAMELCYDYFNKKKNELVWAWGSHFDAPILEAAMGKAGISKTPWKHWNVKDARTVSSIFQAKINRDEGVHHNAMDDSKAQAKFLMEVFTE